MKNVCVDNLCPCLPQCGIGTMMFGKTMDQSKSNEIIGFSLDNGLNFFDTADSYNNGESERILGNALKGRRDEAIIATKVGYNISGNMSVDLSPAAIRRSVEMSLCNIRTDRIDILYLHAPDYSTPVTHSLREIQHLIDQGKILDWGVSNYAAWQISDMIKAADETGMKGPVLTQNVYNTVSRRIEDEMIPFILSKQLGLVVYNPLAGGLLTGKYISADNNSGGRLSWNEMYRNRYCKKETYNAISALNEIAAGNGMSLTELSLRWLISQPAVTSVLMGMSSLEQLTSNIAKITKGPLSKSMLLQIDAVREITEGTSPKYNR